jgi:hypothetical protein
VDAGRPRNPFHFTARELPVKGVRQNIHVKDPASADSQQESRNK